MTDFLPDIYYQDKQLSTSPEHRSGSQGEQRLWQRVMAQIVNDALGKVRDVSDKREKDNIQRYAIRWLMKNRKDFNMVCHLAGLSPQWVRERAIRTLRQKGLIP